MITHTMLTLADLHFALGLIDGTEYEERTQIALWLATDRSTPSDPREPRVPDRDEMGGGGEPASCGESRVSRAARSKADSPDWIELVLLSKWYFTRSDPDPYPSTPHGHLNSANQKWPKLNPFTGRVFIEKHQEETRHRLTKNEMKKIWRDPDFRDFCRSHIVWHMESHSGALATRKHPLRLPRW